MATVSETLFSESEAPIGVGGAQQVSSVALFTIRLPGQPFELSHPLPISEAALAGSMGS